MSSFTYLTAALALAGAASTTPIQKRDAFSIEQVEHSTFLKNGPAQVVRTLRKFGQPVPANILAAAENRAAIFTAATAGNDSAPAVPTDEQDTLYLTPVVVGNTTLQLDLDTGSADLWVFSNMMPKFQREEHDYYTVNDSKIMKGQSWLIKYGDGSGAMGKVYNEKVTVAGVTANSQAVEAAAYVSTNFWRDRQTDGLLGLAASSLNTVSPKRQKTFFDNVKDSLAKPLFAVSLKYHAAGTYDFGFIDESKYTGPITYVNVEGKKGFWGFRTSGYSIGTNAVTKRSITGFADTGTSLIYLDPAIVSAYYSKVPGAEHDPMQGGWVIPCSADMPDFSIIVGGVAQTVPGKHINYAPVMSDSKICFGGIQSNEGLRVSIFGDIFLKSKYVVHDVSGGKMRLGFAQQAGVQ